MKANTKIPGRIIWAILITMLAAGFYFYMGRHFLMNKNQKILKFQL